MGSVADPASPRGEVTAKRWLARCKDCGREGRSDEFSYPDSWIDGVLERGGTPSDRCPACRQRHNRDTQSMAVPYIDMDVIGVVPDPTAPAGRLGGLGPLPVEHVPLVETRELATYDFGLDDGDVRTLLDALETRQVAVVVAGTGSGKSTFLPYRLMEPPDDVALRLASRGPIVVTEPRRAAAIDTATFVAERLHGSPKVGAGCDIGYRVKDAPAFDASCRLIYVTDGSLINWIRDGQLDRFGAVIIDEAHERNKNIDIILAALRATRPRHPHLRIIIASATIDADFFVDYFGGEDEVFTLHARTEKRFGYGNPIWPCEDVDLQHPDWAAGELHGRPLRDYAKALADLRVVTEPVPPSIEYRGWLQRMPRLVANQVIALHRGTPAGDILAFLPTEATIRDAKAYVEEELSGEADIYGLMRNAPENVQTQARTARPADAVRRIVLATNIAETSLTIEGVTFVVDSGLICQSRWDPQLAQKAMPSLAHSRDGVIQRWGRVGRKAPGFVLPLYTREQFETFEAHTPPEAVRDDLENFVLTATAMGIDGLETIVYPAEHRRPDADASSFRETFSLERSRAKTALNARGALDHMGDITIFGNELLAYQGSMAEAGALIGSDELCCSVETAIALELLLNQRLVGSLLRFRPKWDSTTRAMVGRCHDATFAGCRDDLDVALKVYAGWETAQDRLLWASRYSVSHERLQRAEAGQDTRLKFLSPGRSAPVSQEVRTELADRVRAVLSRALVDFTYVRLDGAWRPLSGDDGIIYTLDNVGPQPTCDRIVALRRFKGRTAKTATLASVVEAFEWAASAPSWMALAWETARRLRDADRALRGLRRDDHWALTDTWPVGLQFEGRASGDGLVSLGRVLTQPEPIRLPQDADADSEVVEVQDEVAAARDEPDDEIAPLSPTVETIFDTESLELHADEADDDGEVSPASPDSGTTPHPTAGPPHPTISVRAVNVDGTALSDGVFRVIGYHGAGATRGLLLSRQASRGSLRGLADAGLKVGSPLATVCTGVVTRWGPPFTSLLEPQTGHELFLGAAELTFSARDRAIAEAIPVRADVLLRVTEFEADQGLLRATRLPLVQQHFERGPSTFKELRGSRRQMRPATVLGERWGDQWIVLQLTHADPATGLLHRYSVNERLFAGAGLQPLAGLPILVELATKGSDRERGRVMKRFTKMPPKIDELARRFQDDIEVDLESGTLAVTGAMTIGLRDGLSRLSNNVQWLRAIMNLWRESNSLTVVAIAPGTDTQAFSVAAAQEALPPGQELEGTVTYVTATYALLRLPGGRTGYLPKSRIGPEGVLAADGAVEKDQRLQVRIERVEPGPDGRVSIQCSAESLEIASKLDQVKLAFPVGAIVQGRVNSVTDFGYFIALDLGQSGLLHRSQVPYDRRFSEGDTISVQVLSVHQGPRRVEIALRLA